MFRTSSNVARLFPRLAYQLVPAAVVTAVGVLLLSNLAKTPSTATNTAIVETPIVAEGVFKATPREVAADAQEQIAKPTKPAAAHAAVKLPPRKPANGPAAEWQVASAPPPLQIVPIAEQPQAIAPPPDGDGSVMGRLRSATATVQRIPQWAVNSVTGWFAANAPPRPPASVPNFQAAM